MARRRLMRVAVALVLALGVRVGHTAPQQMIAAAKAVTCCAKHCHQPKSPPRAAHCCSVRQDAADPSRTPSLAPPEPDTVALPTLGVAAPAVRLATTHVVEHPAHDRAGPVYLLTRSLRC